MLIQPDKNELGDKRLDPKESLARIKEENTALRASMGHQIANQELLQQRKLAEGQKMDWRELIRRLNLLCPFSLVIFDSAVNGRPTIAIKTPAVENGEHVLSYVTGFYKDALPEFSWVEVDEHNCPTVEHRGWRTVVKTLWRRGLTNGKDVARVFPEVLRGDNRAALYTKDLPKF